MYFPYLRGRQFELIALRELVEKSKLSKNIIPIIEPVKVTSTLFNTIKTFNDASHRIAIIKNPEVGSFLIDSKKEKNEKIFNNIEENLINDNIYSTIIITKQNYEIVDCLVKKGTSYDKIISLCLESDNIESFNKAFQYYSPKYNLIPYSPAFRRVRKGERILIDDKFNKLPRNSDYLDNQDEFFSDDHLYCYEDGYSGFSDYSIVGKEYSDSGFAPYAVAIHIVYFASDKTLRIKHFVSDSNNDITDPANKFYEAVKKLVTWNEEQKIDTLAMNAFRKMYDDESYPGLGVVKKLSIMHHMELVGSYLDEV